MEEENLSLVKLILSSLNVVVSKLSNIPNNLRYITYLNVNDNYNIRSGKRFFNGDSIHIYGEGHLTVGENSYCSSRCGIYVSVGHKCTIGSNTSISHNVRIYTSNRNPNDIISCSNKINLISGNVIIGNNCWIGANVFINQGVVIGDNVVIGANSVVTKNIPSNSIAVGAPIRVIKELRNINEK